MANNLAVGDIVEVSNFCRTAQLQNQVNVKRLKVMSLAGGDMTDQTAVQLMSDFYGPAYASLLPTTATYLGSKLRRLFPGPTQAVIGSTGSAVGTVAGDLLPSQTSGLVTLRATGAPPRHRGRFYAPSPCEPQNDASGNPSAAYLVTLGTAGADYIGTVTLTAGGVTLTMRHGLLIPFAADGIFYPFDTRSARTRWATQRRRSDINRTDSAPF